MYPFEINLPDYEFLLHDVVNISNLDLEGYSELDRDFTSAILDEAFKLARDVLAPLNAVGDTQGCTFENGVVRAPEGFKAAFDAVREGGWTGLDCDPQYGGQGLPYLLAMAVLEIHVSANMALNMYPGLTHGAYSAIHAHGSEEQKQTYLPKMINCEWTGTMNLTEPHAGTDLGIIRSKADPQDDGSYKISGQKIFISAGEHDMAENIIHLVLARLPDAPEGVKGISLFIVPKFMVNEDGSLGERNALSCGKVEEKMGIHGNSTCVMNYDDATGFLIGEPHKGLKYMFTMMNEARLGVGMQGLAQAEGAYNLSRQYAMERLQGRAVPEPAEPNKPADPLIVHPDIRRNLMTQKAFVEGGRALVYWLAHHIDRFRIAGDKEADEFASLLMPVVKGYLTDKGFESTVLAQQVFGGHGYITETGISQFVRDARITMIYEGTSGIQALDLVGRKLAQNGGAAMQRFFGTVIEEVQSVKGNARLEELATPLKEASKALQASVMSFVEKGMKNPNFALSGATDFMHLFGATALGLMWLRMAKTADKMLEAGEGHTEFLDAKLVTAKFYMTHMLPDVLTLAARIQAGEETIMALAPEAF